MPSPKKKTPYAIIRDDNTFVVYDLTSDHFKQIEDALMVELKFVSLKGVGLIGLKDVRAVVEQREEPKKVAKEKPLESANPEMDAVSAHWLKQQKELIRIQQEEQDWFDKQDDELEGGRFS